MLRDRSSSKRQDQYAVRLQPALHSRTQSWLSMVEVTQRDPLCRFYTRPLIGDLLVDLMPRRPRPRRLIDLGAGAGILSDAATRRWGRTDIITVDVDGTCALGLQARLRSARRQHVHHTLDALDPDLPEIVSTGGAIDAAICNPPYLKPEWRPGFERVLSEAGLEAAFASPTDVTAEALFLAQAVRLTSRGGSVGLIVPDGLITGLKTANLRRVLLSEHRIDSVVQLPRSSFKDADAQAFILIFGNYAKRAKKVKLLRFDPPTGLSQPIYVGAEEAEHRLDYDFHAVAGTPAHTTLRNIGAQVDRGGINATVARGAGLHVFHTSHFDPATGGRLNLPEGPIPGPVGNLPVIVAEPGDILIARVDRNLHRKVAMVETGRAAITDCVYRVRVPEPLREPCFAALRAEDGAKLLAAAARGVGARHLSKVELMDLAFLPEHEAARW